ncbi:MAG: UDP-N-acetylmuramoyl-L-alanyl-D-glutamate--2,6-diaminopimelate ligase [marine bacterium B5-7]|nr:MAG: UDP-N-acetylmuramoyl-L-alanyl-D-glutamate--2,6-diaminopimelate ligase [marine bacterium B5-7]
MNTSVAERSLNELTRGLADSVNWRDVVVTGITQDSREVKRGDLFLAVPGERSDGRRFIRQCIDAGAAAVLAQAPVEWPDDDSTNNAPVYQVTDLRRYVGTIADRFYGQPSRRLCVIGITGTNGKTSCSHLLAQALELLGGQSGVLGTLGNGRPTALKPSPLTTLDAVAVHRELDALDQSGARFVCMEVSSHALSQGRVDKVAFDLAVFTNLTQDHLDYHDDMASYGNAKARLFAYPDLSACVINIDDAFGRHLASDIDMELLWSYGDSTDARVRRQSLDMSGGRISMQVNIGDDTVELVSDLPGRFNADNILTVFATLLAMGFDHSRVVEALSKLQPVPGRMEIFSSPGKPRVVVDFAHTPDALDKALNACRELNPEKLWVVFGCGGDRDRDKRARMGAIASRLADKVVITSDNPRSEDPLAIINDIALGTDGDAVLIEDRRNAIAHAIDKSNPGDMVLVAGKGHETTQTIGDVVRPFSDRDTVVSLLNGAS